MGLLYKIVNLTLSPGDFTVTVSDINGLLFLFFLMKIIVKQVFE